MRLATELLLLGMSLLLLRMGLLRHLPRRRRRLRLLLIARWGKRRAGVAGSGECVNVPLKLLQLASCRIAGCDYAHELLQLDIG